MHRDIHHCTRTSYQINIKEIKPTINFKIRGHKYFDTFELGDCSVINKLQVNKVMMLKMWAPTEKWKPTDL